MPAACSSTQSEHLSMTQAPSLPRDGRNFWVKAERTIAHRLHPPPAKARRQGGRPAPQQTLRGLPRRPRGGGHRGGPSWGQLATPAPSELPAIFAVLWSRPRLPPRGAGGRSGLRRLCAPASAAPGPEPQAPPQVPGRLASLFVLILISPRPARADSPCQSFSSSSASLPPPYWATKKRGLVFSGCFSPPPLSPLAHGSATPTPARFGERLGLWDLRACTRPDSDGLCHPLRLPGPLPSPPSRSPVHLISGDSRRPCRGFPAAPARS
nr:skin secretory protein xP2-like [Macaca nemestrina]